MTDPFQPAILKPIPPCGRYLLFSSLHRDQSSATLQRLQKRANAEKMVVGIGASLAGVLGAEIPGLRPFPAFEGAIVPTPASSSDLLIILHAKDRGALVLETAALIDMLLPAFDLEAAVDTFKHDTGRDLTGYEDGTENPRGRKAIAAAFAADAPPGIAGSSYVAIQQWSHDFAVFNAMASRARDHAFGRRRRDNLELVKAPASSHVKRTAQESFSPEAFLLRRSMPWTDGKRSGLMFTAFGSSFNAFEAQMRRMVGLEDQVPDAIYAFTRPLNGYYFWCPPVRGQRLDLRAFGIR